MFNWLKKLFGFDIPDTPVIAQETVKEAPKATVGKVTKVKSEIPAPKAEQAKTPAKPKKQSEKPATKKEEPAKRGRKKTGITKTDLNKMNKDQLETFAKKEFKVDIDKRMKKADLVDQIMELSKKNS